MRTLTQNKLFSIILCALITMLAVLGITFSTNTVKAAELEETTLTYDVEQAQELKVGDSLFGKYLFIPGDLCAIDGAEIYLDIAYADFAAITFDEGLIVYGIKIGDYENVVENNLYYKAGKIGDVEGYFYDFTAPVEVEMENSTGEYTYVYTLDESNLTVREILGGTLSIIEGPTEEDKDFDEKVDGFLGNIGEWCSQAGEDVSAWLQSETGLVISGSSIIVGVVIIVVIVSIFKKK